MKRLIIADLFSYNAGGFKTGHYFALCDNYIDLFSNEFDVYVAGGNIYKTGSYDKRLVLLPCDSFNNENVFKWHLKIFRNFTSLMKLSRVDDIIVIQTAKAASCILAIALFGRKDRCIYLIEYDTSALKSMIKRFVYKIAKRYIKGIICPSDNIGKTYNLPYCAVSDYIYTGQDSDYPDYESRPYDYVMVGRIVKEKGICEAAKRLAGSDLQVLIAGRAPKELEQPLIDIANSCDNIDLRLGFVSNDDYRKYLQQSKFGILNYQDAYANRSSGVVLDVVFSGTPVVGRRCMATQFIEDNKLGYLYDNIDSFDFHSICNKNCFELSQNNIKKYLKSHLEYRQKLKNFLKGIRQ